MEQKKILLAMSIAASTMTLVACGGSSSNDDGGNGGDTVSLQELAVSNGQVQLIEVDPNFNALYAAQATEAGSVATTSPNAFFDDTGYIGAVDPAAGAGWWEGWTMVVAGGDGMIGSTDFHPLADNIGTDITAAAPAACPAGADNGTATIAGEAFPICELSEGDLDGNITLTNDHVYLLTETVSVGDGDAETGHTVSYTLTIEPGTMIYGTGAAALVITRGSMIDADGTAEMPILMLGYNADDADPYNTFSGRGEWGGLIIDGYAPVNAADASGNVASEAVADGVIRYFGGNDAADNSGTVRYVVIGESGYAFRPDQEVQGWTAEGVGSGTTVEYMQIFGSEDDGIEWFGGSVNQKYLLINGQDDDALDMDLGFNGMIQYALVIMGASNGDHGIESDSNGSNFDATPATAPTIMNMTIAGNVGKGSTRGVLHREGFRGQVYRSIIADASASAGFVGGCLDIDHVLPATLEWADVIVNCTGGSLATADEEVAAP